ncbi:Spag6 [Symbiodinium natans]|uniref:Spag6 protein n=1 Tax=Symbiodinium natans TaxID=878477 RepID=A0A812IBY1_9DINO|nr:Spag6 [Symbiodinium natans]
MADAQGLDLSLAAFIGAAKPDLKPTQLVVVEEKLGKVGVTNVQELAHALRGRNERSLNNRLRAVGEKCFTSETLSALRQRVREEPSLRRSRRQAGEVLKGFARETSRSEAMPTSKEGMVQALEDLGLEVSRCQVREMRALLLEARRLSALQRPDLAAEVRGRLGRNPERSTSSEELIRQLLEASFPDTLEPRNTADFERSKSDEEDGFTFEILAPTPEALSLSTLTAHSEEELRAQCKARGLWTDELQSKSKGFLAVLLKMESRREYLQSLPQVQD